MYFELEEHLGTAWAPNVDVCERAAEIVVFVELPGLDRDDLRISWRDGVLSITGQKRRQPPESGIARYLCVERTYGPFRRDIAVHLRVDYSRGFAKLENGLLQIHLPKETSKPVEVVIPIS